ISTINYEFLGSSSSGVVYGTSEKNNILSVYGSILNATHPGVNGSGGLFNITYNGTLTLRYTTAIYANGTVVHTYYNDSDDDDDDDDDGDGGGGGSGGGGGVGTPLPDEFDVFPDTMKITIRQDEIKRETIIITNNLDTTLNISDINPGRLERFVAGITPESILLLPRESAKVSIDFFAREDETPDTYIGRITVKGGRTTETINTIIEVQEKEPLFDVTVNLNKESYTPGEPVIATIGVTNFGDLTDIDVLLRTELKTFDGKTLAFEEGSYAIENYQLQVVNKLTIPRNTQIGEYIFYARATYEEQGIRATGSKLFAVEDPSFSPLFDTGNFFILILLPIVTLVIVIVAIIIFVNLRKKQPIQTNIQPAINS
ncbi:MAG: hypothetical protein ABIH92_01970, partial [Nanoarchaeota archaeon]